MMLVTVSTSRDRRCLSRRSSLRRSWMNLLARPQCCNMAGQSTWIRLCRPSVQLPRPASCPCDGTAPVSTTLARLCRRQRPSVRRSLMAVQVCRQPPPTTTRTRSLSTSCRHSYPSTLTSVSCRRCLTRSRSMWICRAVVDAVLPCRRRTFTSATSPL